MAVLSRVALALLGAFVAQPASLEYQVKAAYLYHFAKFVEWPAGKSAPDGPIVICVFGRDPFGQVLPDTVQGKLVNGRPLALRRVDGLAEVRGCGILFAGTADAAQLGLVLARAAEVSVLTVGDSRSFEELGGMIRFILEDDKVRFDINLEAARRARISISSQLLKVAKTVRGRAQP